MAKTIRKFRPADNDEFVRPTSRDRGITHNRENAKVKSELRDFLKRNPL